MVTEHTYFLPYEDRVYGELAHDEDICSDLRKCWKEINITFEVHRCNGVSRWKTEDGKIIYRTIIALPNTNKSPTQQNEFKIFDEVID